MKKVVMAAMAAASIPALATAQQTSLELHNAPSTRPKTSTTVTAKVVNRSRTDVANGMVVFDNDHFSCTVTFGPIRSLGGSAFGSCVLDGPAMFVKSGFTGTDGSRWFGSAGNGQPFTAIDINLNDAKKRPD